jgi:hypothetical protein
MKSRGHQIIVGASWVLLASFLGCAAPDAMEAPSLGTLSMPLATIVNGIRYRLTADTFLLTGPITRTLQQNGSGTIVIATLPEGEYAVELSEGWTLERQTDDGFEAVQAELVSPNPRPIEIVSGETSSVAWLFQTDGIPVGLEPPGFFQGNLAVVDSTNPTDDIVGDVLATEQAHVDALAGVVNIDGSLTIAGSLESLAPLADLTSITGALEISANAALTSLRGLAALNAVESVTVTNNPLLPTCEAEWLVDNITLGLGGTIGDVLPDGSVEAGEVEIAGNDDSGTCSP